jgi:TonB family protein
MKFIKPEKKRHEIIAAVCFSLLIHATAGALLVLGLPSNPISSPKLNGLNLVWVSLNSKSNNSGMAIQKGSPKQMSEREDKGVFALNESTKILVSLEKYNVYGARATEEQTSPIDSYSAGQIAGSTSTSGTVTAYPLYRQNTPPVYPEIARIRGYEGVVLVVAEILPDGRVGSTKIRRSSGYAILDRSAIDAVKPWKFEPAKKFGKPFTIWVELPIKFILHDDNSQS